MKRLHKTITTMLALLLSASFDLIHQLWKKPAVVLRPIEMQQPVPLRDGGDRQQMHEQEHNHLESADPESQERPARSIAPPPGVLPIPYDDAWQQPVMAAVQRNQHYAFSHTELD